VDSVNLEKIKAKGESYKRFGAGRGVHYSNASCALYIAFSPVSLPMAKDWGKVLVPFAWSLKIEDYLKEGRTVGELWQELDNIAKELELNAKTKRLAIYVEDLSVVFQSLRMLKDFPEVLAKGYNKPLKAMRDNGIEFRSLEDYRGQEEVQNFKAFKTEEPLGPQSKLKFDEILQINLNACAMVDYIRQHVDIYKGIGRLSLTMVGRTRNATKHEMFNKQNREAMTKLFETLKLSPEVYRDCLEALWGGFAYTFDTMAKDIWENVIAYDENSAYLAQMYCRPMPMDLRGTYENPGKEMCKWIRQGRTQGGSQILSIVYIEVEGLEIGAHGIATLLERHAKNHKGLECNQGHILSAEHVEFWLTNLDLYLLELLYKVKSLKITKAHVFNADLLPNCIISPLLEKYKIKTKNKGDEKMKHSPIYLDCKSALGAGFGVHAMDITKDEHRYVKALYKRQSDGQIVWDWTWITDKGLEEYKTSKIEAEMNKTTRSTYLPWGIFISSWARFCLVSTIYNIVTKTKTRCLCNDTDSLYSWNMTKEAHEILNKYNKQIRQHLEMATKERNDMLDRQIKDNKKKQEEEDKKNTKKKRQTKPQVVEYFKMEDVELADANGKLHTLGAFEIDGEYVKAKSIHAKCHLFLEKSGKYKLTLAGQPNEKALAYLLEQPDPFAAFSNGLVIPAERSGKYLVTYIDNTQPQEVIFKDRDNKTQYLIMQHAIAQKPIAFSIDDVEDF